MAPASSASPTLARRQGPHEPEDPGDSHVGINTAPSTAAHVADHVQPTSPSTPDTGFHTARRHTRASGQKLEVQTLPGTEWEKLDIERKREALGHPENTKIPETSRSAACLPLHQNQAQSPKQTTKSSEAIRVTSSVSSVWQRQAQARTPGHSPSPSSNITANQALAVASSSPVKKHRIGPLQPKQHQVSQSHHDQAVPGSGQEEAQPTQTCTIHLSEDTLHSKMARRPGRNQLDHVADLKDTLHDSLSKLSNIQEQVTSLGKQIMTLEEELKAKENEGDITLDDTKKLDDLYRKMLKLTEEESSILKNPPDDPINMIGVLNALAASEDTQMPGRGSAASKQRGSKRSTVDSEAAAIDPPILSPSEARSSDQLRRVKGQSQRSTSVASQTPRDGASRQDDGSDGSRSSVAERAKMLVLHAEVAYKQSKTTHDSDGERIHCTINGIRKDKPSGRAVYDIKDKDESENLLYTAKAEDLLPIPPLNSQLPSFAPGRHVIALYPGTTTFYNAQVIGLFPKRDVYSLKFEGEENEKEVKEVERRYVLDTKAK